MRVVIDTNVILDVLQRRKGFFDESYAVLKLAAEDNVEALTPAGSIADAYYIIRKSLKDPSAARDAIAALLQLVSACDTTASDISAALTLAVADFEDAILASTAKHEKAEYIITRDEQDFRNSPVPAISPKGFLVLYQDQRGA